MCIIVFHDTYFLTFLFCFPHSSCPKTGTCDWNNFNAPGPNPQTLTGALIGGPDRNDNFRNDRGDYIYNEVTTDYNAGFQSAVAGKMMIRHDI